MILLLLAACNLYLEDTKVHYDVPEELEGQVLFVTKGISNINNYSVQTKTTTSSISSLDAGFNFSCLRTSYDYSVYNNVLFEKNGNFWSGNVYWPNSNAQYRFYACYPSSYSMSKASGNYNGLCIDASTEDDILCCYLENPTFNDVNTLDFEHIFARIGTIRVESSSEYTISNFTIKITPQISGKYNLKYRTWSSIVESNIERTYTYSGGISPNSYVNITNFSDIYTIPNSYVITATWTASMSNTGYSETFTDRHLVVELAAGKINNITFTMTGNAPRILVDVNVLNWSDNILYGGLFQNDDDGQEAVGVFTINDDGDQIGFAPGFLEAHIASVDESGVYSIDEWRFKEDMISPFSTNYSVNSWTSNFVFVGNLASIKTYGVIDATTLSSSTGINYYRGSYIYKDYGLIPEVVQSVGFGWRMLSWEELDYIINERETGITINGIENVRYTFCGTISTKNQSCTSFIIFPDNFESDMFPLSNFTYFNSLTGGDFRYSNRLSKEQCEQLRVAGCVFIPLSDTYIGNSNIISNQKYCRYTFNIMNGTVSGYRSYTAAGSSETMDVRGNMILLVKDLSN